MHFARVSAVIYLRPTFLWPAPRTPRAECGMQTDEAPPDGHLGRAQLDDHDAMDYLDFTMQDAMHQDLAITPNEETSDSV